jgi:hypothetical protein
MESDVMPTAPEPSGGFIAATGVLRPPQMSHREISAKGGRAKTAAKLEAVMRNLERAKAARAARRAKV